MANRAGMMSGLSRGFQGGFGMVQGHYDKRHQQQRQMEQDAFQRERFDAQQDHRDRTFQATQDHRDRTFGLQEQAHESTQKDQHRQRQQQDLERLYRLLDQDNPSMDAVNQFIQTHQDTLDPLIPGDNRHPVGIAPSDDDPNRFTVLVENDWTGTVGPMQEQGSTSDSDPVMTFSREDLLAPFDDARHMPGMGTPGGEPGRAQASVPRPGAQFSRGDIGAMAGMEMSQPASWGELQQHPQLGYGQFDSEGRWHAASEGAGAPGSMEGGSMAGGIEYGSADYKRVMDMLDRSSNRVFTTYLGEDFVGDPENAQVRGIAQEAAFNIIDGSLAEDQRLNPSTVGSLAAEIALSDDFTALRPSDAREQARQELAEEMRQESGWIRNPMAQPDPEAVEERARELHAQQRQELERRVRDRLGSDGQMGMGAPPQGGGTPQSGGQGMPQGQGQGGQGQPQGQGMPSTQEAVAAPVVDAMTQHGILTSQPQGGGAPGGQSIEPGMPLGDTGNLSPRQGTAGTKAHESIQRGSELDRERERELAEEERVRDRTDGGDPGYGISLSNVPNPIAGARDFMRDLTQGEREGAPEPMERFVSTWEGGDMPDQETAAQAYEWALANTDRLTPEQAKAIIAARDHYGLKRSR